MTKTSFAQQTDNSLSSCLLALRKSFAFTLAEVLITLAIIGVVAAMTIPSLITKHQEKVTSTKLKEAYSIVSQAYLRAEQENGDIGTWGFDSGIKTDEVGLTDVAYSNMNLFWSMLIPYMQVGSSCFNDTTQKCESTDIYELNGTFRNNRVGTSIKLNNGITFLGGWIESVNCPDSNTYCGDFFVDVNGQKSPPNTIGKDIFYFEIRKNRILPIGHDDNSFNNSCLNGGNGYGCTAWVIYKGNQDYLHCNDLSWHGKNSCK